MQTTSSLGDTIEELQITGTTGSFTLSFGGITTTSISATASAATVLTDLTSVLGSGNATVAGIADNFVITFAGSLSNTAVPTPTVNLSGATASLVPLQTGGGNQSEILDFGAGSTGFYSLSFGGQTTINIAATAPAATVQADLEALSTIGQGNVLVFGTSATTGGFLVEFINNLGGQNLPLVAVNNLSLTTTPSSSIVQTGAGNDTQTISLTGATGGTFTLTLNNQTTIPLASTATAAQVQSALQGLSGVGTNNVVVSGNSGGPYTVVFVGNLAFHGVSQITATSSLSPAGATITATTTSSGVFLGASASESIAAATTGTFTLSYNGQTTGRSTSMSMAPACRRP